MLDPKYCVFIIILIVTPTMKIKRKVIKEIYKDLFKDIYGTY
ncbi:hypothetical protein SAMN04488096_102327 [Mesonia phycicola]|uniref:Uncharacterized protein n=1 Tax=Mesonia phycicola TaxID=579105 RepID=A0A1M6C2G4_9FLAO|nr:hypothetical protein SAMN04488096_102327 [Mesonia phycicola]